MNDFHLEAEELEAQLSRLSNLLALRDDNLQTEEWQRSTMKTISSNTSRYLDSVKEALRSGSGHEMKKSACQASTLITPEILGPGIDEEYDDALAAIEEMRVALGAVRLTNSTPEGRVLLNAAWVAQQIDAGRLPIPVKESFVETIFHLVGSNELGHVAGFQEALGRLWLVLKGYGLMKARHVPVLLAMIDDFLAEAARCSSRLDTPAEALLADMRAEGRRLREGGDWPRLRRPQDQFSAQVTPALRTCIERCSGRATAIDTSLFEAWRPSPARKGALPAPVPGLPATAPVLTPDVEARLP